jgi:hypothetical protein
MPNNLNPGVASKIGAVISSTSHQPMAAITISYGPTSPKPRAKLAATAKVAGATLRVSGQQHSQPPLVIGDNRDAPSTTKEFLVEMSCYGDLGPGQDQQA